MYPHQSGILLKWACKCHSDTHRLVESVYWLRICLMWLFISQEIEMCDSFKLSLCFWLRIQSVLIKDEMKRKESEDERLCVNAPVCKDVVKCYLLSVTINCLYGGKNLEANVGHSSFLIRAQSFLCVPVSGLQREFLLLLSNRMVNWSRPLILNATLKTRTRLEGEVCFLCPQDNVCGCRIEPAQLGV